MCKSLTGTPPHTRLRDRTTLSVPSTPGGNNPPATPRDNQERQTTQPSGPAPKKKSLRANIKIASLNINSATLPTENMSYQLKWKTISNTIQKDRIAILALQEAHLDEQMAMQL
jgi:hypothetical protein